MFSFRVLGALALCAVPLVACSKPAAGGKPASAAPGKPVTITRDQLPHPLAGAWTMIVTSGGPPTAGRICVTDRPFNVGRTHNLCQSYVFHRTAAGQITIDSRCASHGTTSTMHLVAQGDFQAAYDTDMRMTIVLQPGAPPRTITSHTEYRYAGPCSPSEQADVQRAGTGR